MALSDRLYAARDRLIASPRFQKFAGLSPFTRPIARRQASKLFDLCAGFVYSQVLLACVRLDVFDALRSGPLTLQAAARKLDLNDDAARRLLDAAVSLDLLARRSGGRYGLGIAGAAILGNPSIAQLVLHHAALYADLRDPVALLKGDLVDRALAAYWPYAANREAGGLTAEATADYTSLMAASQALVAGQVISAYPLKNHRCLLDVGGGDGAFLSAVARHAPDLKLMLFDLPPVAARAQARFEREGLSLRASAFGGDFGVGALPEGADIVSLVRIIHDHDDDVVARLLQSVHRVLQRDGTLLIAEPMSGQRGSERMADAYFGFYLMAMGSGRARTVDEIGRLATAAGFSRVRHISSAMPLAASVIVAKA